MFKAKITAVGHYIPEKVIDNNYLAQKFNKESELITQKTGIKERRYFENGNTSDMAIFAIQNLLEKYNINKEDIDCLILATSTPDFFFPSTASLIISKMKINNCWGFDISSACTGFMYALHIGKNLIENNSAKKVLICGADKLSTILSDKDYRTSFLFGDGAGVVLLEKTNLKDENIIINTECNLVGDSTMQVYLKSGLNSSDRKIDSIYMEKGAVYQSGVNLMSSFLKNYLSKNKLVDNFDYFLPHQANLVMLKEVVKNCDININSVLLNVSMIGNTGAASIPLCISQFADIDTFKTPKKTILMGFGAGYSISIGLVNIQL
jgi:3-oxoacyl-[acyl-carrier-protein] synthase-3